MANAVTGRTAGLRALRALVEQKRAHGTYRAFTELRPVAGAFPWFEDAGGRRVLNMSSNDYLGLSQAPAARRAAIAYIEHHGLGSGGSRNIGGTRPEHEALEDVLKDIHGVEDCLLYPSANAANGDAISVLARRLPRPVFFSDEENHASIIEPLRNLQADARRVVFAHNSLTDLQERFFATVTAGSVPVLVMESLYSMSGDWGDLEALCGWIRQHGGLVVVNEVHAVGVCGETGGGRLADLGLAGLADLVIGSLSKAFGGVGGYIAGSAAIVDACRQTGVRSIFTTSLPGAVVAASLENVRARADDPEPARTLLTRVAQLRAELDGAGVGWSGGVGGHITKVPIGDEATCQAVCAGLLRRGFYATAIRHPTVPKGAAQLRATVNPFHEPEMIASFASALADEAAIATRAHARSQRLAAP